MARCLLCPSLVEGCEYRVNDRILTRHGKVTCVSENVIYAVICNKCNHIYIGETQTQLRKRMTLHRFHVKNVAYQILNVSAHVMSCGEGSVFGPYTN